MRLIDGKINKWEIRRAIDGYTHGDGATVGDALVMYMEGCCNSGTIITRNEILEAIGDTDTVAQLAMEEAWIEYAKNTGWNIGVGEIVDWAMCEMKSMITTDGKFSTTWGVTQDMLDWMESYIEYEGISWEDVADEWEVQ